MKLFERAEKIAIHFEGSRAGLAKRLATLEGKTPRAIEGYFNEEREDNFWPLLPKILTMYPEINDTWLYLGRGPMLKSETAAPPLSATNGAGKYPGDWLHAALSILRLTPEQAASELGWNSTELQCLLESRELPTFEQLEKFYMILDISPDYFFHGDERRMHRPKDALLQVFYALGKRSTEPDKYEVAEIFGLDENTAQNFLTEWRTARKEKRNLCLREEWLAYLEERYRFNAGWLADGTPPVIQKVETVKPRRSANSGIAGTKTPPTPHIDVRLLQEAIELIDSSLQSWNRSLPPRDKANLFAQCYEKLLEDGENSVSAQRTKLIIELLTKVPS